jgi:polynucleotide 5'-kinase involved in rRNA processing
MKLMTATNTAEPMIDPRMGKRVPPTLFHVVLSICECYHHRFMSGRAHRIVVIGASGSGKSVLAARLARSLGAAFVGLDALNWGPR